MVSVAEGDLNIRVRSVAVTDDELVVGLMDGRTIAVPLAWYPRLLDATPDQRAGWEIAGAGYGIHWPDLDEDLSTEGCCVARVRRVGLGGGLARNPWGDGDECWVAGRADGVLGDARLPDAAFGFGGSTCGAGSMWKGRRARVLRMDARRDSKCWVSSGRRPSWRFTVKTYAPPGTRLRR